MRYLFVLLLAAPAVAQMFSFGVKAGVPLGDPILNSVTSDARRYLFGGTAEVHLTDKFSVELDAIYKRTGYNSAGDILILIFSENVRANQWEFPLLAKYEILGGRVRPFIDSGAVLRHISGIRDSYFDYSPIYRTGDSGTSTSTSDLTHRNSPGFAVGGGVTWKVAHLRISPEVRYTRWGTNAFEFGPPGISNPNQEDFLLGITF